MNSQQCVKNQKSVFEKKKFFEVRHKLLSICFFKTLSIIKNVKMKFRIINNYQLFIIIWKIDLKLLSWRWRVKIFDWSVNRRVRGAVAASRKFVFFRSGWGLLPKTHRIVCTICLLNPKNLSTVKIDLTLSKM